ncbi:MAG: M20/M25/M40 family metallo-hydrolase, partial [Desulfovibrio sp.]|nr:M20/M25/M40 family metallo-hydrolase [Desulfovibrio sp.]
MSDRSEAYAEILARMIRQETVSEQDVVGGDKFAAFRDLLRELFPQLFGACEVRTFHDSLLLLWKGQDRGAEPVLFLNHMDVVEATGEWNRPPFSGDISDGKLWGRGALDDKGGLWAMLQAAEELAGEGFAPARDIYFMSSCTEETSGRGAEEIAAWFEENDIRLAMSFDEGGM